MASSALNPARANRVSAMALAGVVALLLVGGGSRASATASPVTITNYADPTHDIRWGQRSHWKQPWRSYLDTVPAATLLDAVGINFNVSPKWVPSTARLIANSGFKRARIEVGWGTLDYDDPSRMTELDRANLIKTLTTLRDYGIRPLILLNANEGRPCPVKRDTIQLSSQASPGDSVIHVDPLDLEKIVLGRTGISSEGAAAHHLLTSSDPDGTVRLSKPLFSTLPAGPLDVVTLRYEPFRPATLADGSPNPRFFGETLQAWLDYVGVVTREVKAVLGSEGFDVEIWNELSFGSRFLSINGYYDPDVEWRKAGNHSEILAHTVEYLRDPANGVAGIGIGNGFANQSPWWSGTMSPLGLTAIDKHPYAGWESFPAEAQVNGNRPLNGLGIPDGWKDADNQYHETFTPTYDGFFPERPLSAIHTETLVHDLAPEPTTILDVAHGRYTHPEGSDPPTMWITEVNLGPGSGPTPRTEMTEQDIQHIEAKNILRYLVAYVNKGVTAIHFYAANAGELSLIDKGFFAVKAHQSVYPGDAMGGKTTDAVRRLTTSMQGAQWLASPRSLSLRALTDYEENLQFEGNGTADYPPLYNRDVFAFFPFQVDQDRFVIPVYVMTRNVAEVHRPGASSSDPTRFDLAPERYRMAIGGVHGEGAQVSATDPLSGETVPVEVVSGTGDQLVIELQVTDSPRLLTIQEQEDVVVDPPTSDDGSGAPPARSTKRPGRETQPPRLRLRGGRSLLRKRKMQVETWCETQCALYVRGRLVIGPRVFKMSVRQGGHPGGEGDPSLTAVLTVSARLAALGRQALRRGTPVRVSVTAQAQPQGGRAETSHRVFVLR